VALTPDTQFWHPAPGVRLRLLFRGCPQARGTVLVLHGRTEYLERYAALFDAWQARGYAVLSLDWRNQGLSHRPLSDPQKHHMPDFTVMVEDLQGLFAHAQAQGWWQGRRLIFAHSMGATVALTWLIRETDPPLDAAILHAPMIDLPLKTPRLVREMTKAACRLGLARAYVPGRGPAIKQGKLSGAREHFTRDTEVQAAEQALWEANPDLAVGGVTWGWLAGAFEAIDALAGPGMAERITVPTLVVRAGAETVVDNDAIARFAQAMPNGHMVTIDGAMHEIYRDLDPYRRQLWQDIDGFLAGL